MKTLIIREKDFKRVVPQWIFWIPFIGLDYKHDAMTIGHYGILEYGYNKIEDLPKYYRKLVKIRLICPECGKEFDLQEALHGKIPMLGREYHIICPGCIIILPKKLYKVRYVEENRECT